MARSKRGQGLIEYALLLALGAAVAVSVIGLAAPQVAGIYKRVNDGLANPAALVFNPGPAAVPVAVPDVIATAEPTPASSATPTATSQPTPAATPAPTPAATPAPVAAATPAPVAAATPAPTPAAPRASDDGQGQHGHHRD